jgi:hypothetical protein
LADQGYPADYQLSQPRKDTEQSAGGPRARRHHTAISTEKKDGSFVEKELQKIDKNL